VIDPPPSDRPNDSQASLGDAAGEPVAPAAAAWPPPPPGVYLPSLPPPQPTYAPGTNGLAIAALCCGIFGLFLVSSILGVVFGIVALNQLRARPQKGRNMAIGGIVSGSAWLVVWAALIGIGLTSGPERDATGKVTAQGTVVLEELRAGDCFDGVPTGEETWHSRDSVTVKPCAGPHEAEVGAVVTLPDGDFPGSDEAFDLASTACTDRLEPLMRDEAFDQTDLLIFYPDSAFAWRMDRSAMCILVALQDTMTGSVLIGV
jgi:hypothetical protein